MLVKVSDFAPEDVLPFIVLKPRKGDEKDRVYAGYRVAMDSLRYHCFAASLACERCGIVGDVMRLEYNDTDKTRPADRAHFNLYAVGAGPDGEDVLLTKDHIVPKSKGGQDTLKNLRTYCGPCNWERGDGRPGGNGVKKKG